MGGGGGKKPSTLLAKATSRAAPNTAAGEDARGLSQERKKEKRKEIKNDRAQKCLRSVSTKLSPFGQDFDLGEGVTAKALFFSLVPKPPEREGNERGWGRRGRVGHVQSRPLSSEQLGGAISDTTGSSGPGDPRFGGRGGWGSKASS